VLGGVTNCTVAAGAGWKTGTRGIVTRMNGAPAGQVNVPGPSSLTSVAVVVIAGALTTKEPK
jgi:hypothetical protein